MESAVKGVDPVAQGSAAKRTHLEGDDPALPGRSLLFRHACQRLLTTTGLGWAAEDENS